MDNFIEKYKHVWGDSPKQLMEEYNYQSELTDKLDNFNIEEFNREIFYEIVLWKLNRHPRIEDSLLNELKILSLLKPQHHRESLSILKKLLSCHGIRLPMASTIFRFLNPDVFQIIDDRAYRVLLPKCKMPTKPKVINENYLSESCSIYFDYLDELHNVCNDMLPFKESDRILYFLDKKLGNKIGD